MLATQNQTAAQAELRRRYAIEHEGVLVALAAIRDRLTEEFPAPDGDAAVTRYDLDATRALRCELGALLERG